VERRIREALARLRSPNTMVAVGNPVALETP
jgi:hypothetical protein